VAHDWLVEAAYVGSKTTKQFFSHNINPAVYVPGTDAAGNPFSTIANTQQRRIFPNIGRIEQESTAANINYNSLQLKLDKRFGKGFSVLGSYVFSKALGWTTFPGEGGGGTRAPFDARLDYGPLSQDLTHRFVTSFIWELPRLAQSAPLHTLVGGWGLQGIVTWQSGLPFTVRCGCDNSRTGTGADTPDQVATAFLPDDRSRGEKLARWFNTDAFVPNAIGTFGTMGINNLRGPGFANVDLALSKRFPIPRRERHNLLFRAEFFNLFNHPNFGLPNSTLAARATFGRITSSGGLPRVLEFAMRYAF
jgi:hypothetical protein